VVRCHSDWWFHRFRWFQMLPLEVSDDFSVTTGGFRWFQCYHWWFQMISVLPLVVFDGSAFRHRFQGGFSVATGGLCADLRDRLTDSCVLLGHHTWIRPNTNTIKISAILKNVDCVIYIFVYLLSSVLHAFILENGRNRTILCDYMALLSFGLL